MKTKDNTSERENLWNVFNIKVQAAETKELKKEKAQPVVYSGGDTGASWGGDCDKNTVSYSIEAPLICEGNTIKTITYKINKGAFQIKVLRNSAYILQGVECKEIKCGGFLPEKMERNPEKYEEKYYTSYTILPDKQTSSDILVCICNRRKVSKKVLNRIWGHGFDNLEEIMKGQNEVLGI